MKDLQFNFETLSVETFKDTAETIPEKHASFKKDTEVQTKYLSETKKKQINHEMVTSKK